LMNLLFEQSIEIKARCPMDYNVRREFFE